MEDVIRAACEKQREGINPRDYAAGLAYIDALVRKCDRGVQTQSDTIDFYTYAQKLDNFIIPALELLLENPSSQERAFLKQKLAFEPMDCSNPIDPLLKTVKTHFTHLRNLQTHKVETDSRRRQGLQKHRRGETRRRLSSGEPLIGGESSVAENKHEYRHVLVDLATQENFLERRTSHEEFDECLRRIETSVLSLAEAAIRSKRENSVLYSKLFEWVVDHL